MKEKSIVFLTFNEWWNTEEPTFCINDVFFGFDHPESEKIAEWIWDAATKNAIKGVLEMVITKRKKAPDSRAAIYLQQLERDIKKEFNV